MKKLLLLLIIPFLSFGQDLTYVPDDGFESWIENNIYGASNGDINDNYVYTDAIDTVTTLAIQYVGDLTGIEDFTNLSDLELFFSNAIYIDLSSVFSLTYLRICNSSSLVSLNLQNGFNYNLSGFSLYGNYNLNCIQVDDADWSTANWPTYDPWNYFDEDCEGVNIYEESIPKTLIKTTNILGIETNTTGLQLHIYDDGSVEKKYIIK